MIGGGYVMTLLIYSSIIFEHMDETNTILMKKQKLIRILVQYISIDKK